MIIEIIKKSPGILNFMGSKILIPIDPFLFEAVKRWLNFDAPLGDYPLSTF